MKEHTVCFTGHRKIPPEQVGAVSRRLEKTVLDLIEQGYRYFGAGGALGFDTIAAQTVLNLKIQYPEIRLILVLPCYSQTHGWNKNDKYIYEICRKKADKVVYISKAYSPDCFKRRNRHMIDCSSVCVCYLTHKSGGTAYTVKYALSKSLSVINIA